MSRDGNLKIFRNFFLELDFIGFGRPTTPIVMIQEEAGTQRKWFTVQNFLDLIGATKLLKLLKIKK